MAKICVGKQAKSITVEFDQRKIQDKIEGD